MQRRFPHARPVFVWSVLMIRFFPGCAAPIDYPEIRAVLEDQSAAWNRGDIDGFMQGYWKSDDLSFRTPDGETKGWQAIRERFSARYDTPQKMGRLTFTGIQISSDDTDDAEISGRYHLKREDSSEDSGRFYLNMRRIDGSWVIVKDYTVGNG